MPVQSFTVGPFAENTYLLIEKGDALLIDPGFSQPEEFQHFQRELKQSGATLQAILLTHAHVDHVLGLELVLEQYDVPVYLNDSDRYLWQNFASQAQMFGLQADDFDFEPQNLPIQKKWHIGSFSFDVLYTPGHAPDHVSLFDSEHEYLIAGDALFREGIGRTDLYKGSMEVLKSSIKQELYTLPDDTTVYSGHGSSTSIGYEKQNNPFVKG